MMAVTWQVYVAFLQVRPALSCAFITGGQDHQDLVAVGTTGYTTVIFVSGVIALMGIRHTVLQWPPVFVAWLWPFACGWLLSFLYPPNHLSSVLEKEEEREQGKLYSMKLWSRFSSSHSRPCYSLP